MYTSKGPTIRRITRPSLSGITSTRMMNGQRFSKLTPINTVRTTALMQRSFATRCSLLRTRNGSRQRLRSFGYGWMQMLKRRQRLPTPIWTVSLLRVFAARISVGKTGTTQSSGFCPYTSLPGKFSRTSGKSGHQVPYSNTTSGTTPTSSTKLKTSTVGGTTYRKVSRGCMSGMTAPSAKSWSTRRGPYVRKASFRTNPGMLPRRRALAVSEMTSYS